MTLAGGYYNTATSATATEITTGIWTDVLGGNYNLIIGGSYANNWSGSGKWNVTGDVHTQIQGDTAVNWVVGGNYKDGQAAGIDGKRLRIRGRECRHQGQFDRRRHGSP